MKKIATYFLVALLGFGLSVMAHGPKKILLSFDKDTQTLTADIQHKVKNIESHYISEVIVFVNDKEVKTVSYEKQSEKLNELVEIPLENIKEGDEIKLSAKCNKFGKKSSKLVVE